jgi:hypothetical protein
MPSDNHSDMSRDTVSLTYQELAARLGIDAQSARRRALRSGWHKTPGNDGRARVLVPVTVLPATGTTSATPPPAVLPAVAPTPEALSHLLSQVDEVGELRERLGRLEAEAAAMREALERERNAAFQSRAEAARERDRAEGALIRAAASEGQTEGLRLALEEARRPFWRRWLG